MIEIWVIHIFSEEYSAICYTGIGNEICIVIGQFERVLVYLIRSYGYLFHDFVWIILFHDELLTRDFHIRFQIILIHLSGANIH